MLREVLMCMFELVLNVINKALCEQACTCAVLTAESVSAVFAGRQLEFSGSLVYVQHSKQWHEVFKTCDPAPQWWNTGKTPYKISRRCCLGINTNGVNFTPFLVNGVHVRYANDWFAWQNFRVIYLPGNHSIGFTHTIYQERGKIYTICVDPQATLSW